MIASVVGVGRSLVGQLRVAGVAAMAVALLVACAGSADELVPLEPSILDVIDEGAQEYEAGERYLLSLVVPPSGVGRELEVSTVRVNDPNSDTTVGSGWVRPRIVQHDCTYVVSRELIPLADVAFSENDMVYSVWLALLDDADQQRDVFEIEQAAANILATCSTDDEELAPLVPEVTEIPLIDVGHPGFALRYEDPVGAGILYQYAIGDRVVLQVRHGGPTYDLDLTGVEELLGRQMERLQAAGLDVRSAEPTDVAPTPSSVDQADPSEAGGSGAFGPCGAVSDSGLERVEGAPVVVLNSDVDAEEGELGAIEIFLASNVFVDDFRLLRADGPEPARFVVQLELVSEETALVVSEEMLYLAGVAEVVLPEDC